MTCAYLLDTNICIYIAKQKPKQVLERFEQLEPGDIAMSLITYGELLYGAEKSQDPKKSKHTLQALADLIPPLPLTLEVGDGYAAIRAHLEKNGTLIGSNDLWIAAHAKTLDLILVTNNVKEFARVPQLKIENWV
ncbi:MAG: type II toxin-antitoxin system VapC family toxin [Gammaproteobacteria bacterium]|nr:type II toxin-antitoxin system VapC family toxin [Gammaproteobacteria bacterium]